MTVEREDGLLPPGRFIAEIHAVTVEYTRQGSGYLRLDLTLREPEAVKDRQLFASVTRRFIPELSRACQLPAPESDEDVSYFMRAIKERRILVDVDQQESQELPEGTKKVIYNVVRRYWPIP